MALQTGKIRDVPGSLSTHGMTPGGTRKPERLAVYPKEHPPLPVVLQTWSPNQQSGTTWEPDRKANISGPTPDVLGQKFQSGTQSGRRRSPGCQCTLKSEKYFLCKRVSRASAYLGRHVPASVSWMFPTFPTKGRASGESQHCTTGPEPRLWTAALNHLTRTCLSIPTSGKTCEHRPPP